MKTTSLLISAIAGLLLFAFTTSASAAEKPKGKEVTITGEAKCGMCALKETEKCQTVIQTEGKDGKKVNYYIADNDVAKAFHKEVCKGTKNVVATGSLKTADGKNQLTLTKITPKNN